jgi:hypothetical protein
MSLKDIDNSDNAVRGRSAGKSTIIFILSIGAFAVVNTQLGIIGCHKKINNLACHYSSYLNEWSCIRSLQLSCRVYVENY